MSTNINVNVTLDILKDYGESENFNPTHFNDNIEYTRKNLRYKIDKLQTEFTIRKHEIENCQSLIALTESRIQQSESVSSRNSSPSRPLVRSNADSLKPPILNYSEATVTTVAEHLQRVSDWVNNIFPNGYNFPNYLSNFISSVDKQFTIKAKRFSQCKTEDDVADVLNDLMELKFPIHSRRIDCLNPSINSNEETSSFLKRMLVSFTEAKMSQAHWENILLHLLLKHLPDNEVFRKQREWISNYMSELSSHGATLRADLRKVEKHIQRIEADLKTE